MTVRTRSWPMWLFVALALFVNVSMPPLIEWLDFGSFDKQIQALLFFAGTLVGECCFVANVSGLTKRTWLGAHLFGLALVGAGYCAVFCGLWIANEFEEDLVPGFALAPLLLVAAALPLSGLRHLFGWRLVHGDDRVSKPRPLGLADMFSQMAILASVFVLARVPQVVLENDVSDHWIPLVVTCLILFGVSLVILPLHIRVALGRLSRRRKIVWLLVFPVLIVSVFIGVTQCFVSFNTSFSERLEIVPYILIFLTPAIGMFYGSLWSLVASGLRLVRKADLKQVEESDADRSQAAHLQRVTWWRIGGAVAVTMATSVYLANLQRWRDARDKENAALQTVVDATGGAIGIYDRIPKNISLGPRATDKDFATIAACRDLEHLYFQGSDVTDDGMGPLEHLTSLRALTLENLKITDDGLAPLQYLPNLESLVITNCDISASGIGSLPQKQRLQTLSLSETRFGDDECKMLGEFSALTDLTLSHTHITDRSFVTLGRLAKLTELRLTGTDLTAEQFPPFPILRRLDLSETNANDLSVASLAALPNLQSVILRETNITNSALASLAQTKGLYRADLSDNAIDDAGIRDLGRSTSLVEIDLSGTQVTGLGFSNWQPPQSYARTITLDRTQLTDAGIASMISIGSIDELSLAHTAVTDSCLPHLAQIGINDLDIRGTQITFNGMVTIGLPNVGRLHVGTGQFTQQQIAQLKKQLGIKITIAEP